MPGRTPKEAWDSFLAPLQRALSCVTNAVLYTTGSKRPGETLAATLQRGLPVRLDATTRIALIATVHGRTVEDPALGYWVVRTVGYEYALEDARGQEVIAYHWNPAAASGIRTPHLHVGVDLEFGTGNVGNAHLPSGIVTLVDVIELAIVEFGVIPRRKDWAQVLASARRQLD